jgi:ubiquinone/menaquinone biosynthesis C-methylase UbiE
MKDPLGKALTEWRIKVVLPHVQGYLLDIGCGTNRLVRSYIGRGVGVDVFQWGDVDLVVHNTASLPFDNAIFDTVTLLASLNHIPNREEVLREANRLLTDKGKIIVTMIPPATSRLWHFLRRPWDADQQERGMKEGEKFGFISKEIDIFLMRAGFRVVMKDTFMFGINNLTIGEKTS